MSAPPLSSLDEAFVQQLADVLGPGSASFRAIKELTDCRTRGENVRLGLVGCRLGVVPGHAVAGAVSADAAKSGFPKVRICGALTRSGRLCRQPGMLNGPCRMHGGHRSVRRKDLENSSSRPFAFDRGTWP
jgi:hypothetical protein